MSHISYLKFDFRFLLLFQQWHSKIWNWSLSDTARPVGFMAFNIWPTTGQFWKGFSGWDLSLSGIKKTSEINKERKKERKKERNKERKKERKKKRRKKEKKKGRKEKKKKGRKHSNKINNSWLVLLLFSPKALDTLYQTKQEKYLGSAGFCYLARLLSQQILAMLPALLSGVPVSNCTKGIEREFFLQKWNFQVFFAILSGGMSCKT